MYELGVELEHVLDHHAQRPQAPRAEGLLLEGGGDEGRRQGRGRGEEERTELHGVLSVMCVFVGGGDVCVCVSDVYGCLRRGGSGMDRTCPSSRRPNPHQNALGPCNGDQKRAAPVIQAMQANQSVGSRE